MSDIEKQEIMCYLDVNEGHPALYGEAILPRDDDGMGFSLGLRQLKGKWVKITIEAMPVPEGHRETYGKNILDESTRQVDDCRSGGAS